ncbi:MAG TPA: PAS domain S-box protein, partial [Acidimicrobiales bacterium]|nr:PAS domain S-box protein [Acidimicrobiales bacterium]
VVDDEPDLTFLLRVTLEGRGYEVLQAATGTEAVDAARTHQPDLIVLDVLLPGLDGWGVLQALRGDPSTAGLPVVMLTAISSDEEEMRAYKANVTAFVRKPFSREELLGAVERALAMRSVASARVARRSDPIRRAGESDATPAPAAPAASAGESDDDRAEVLPPALAALVDAVDDAVVGVDADAIVVSWNAGATRITGYQRNEVVGRRLGEVVTTLDPEVVNRLRADAFAGKPIRYALVRCLRKDGTKVEVVMSVTPLPRAEPGAPAAWVVGRDLTTKRWAEARFRSLLEAAPDAVVIVDSRGRIEFVNTQTERQFGYPAQEILGRPVEILIPERLRPGHRGHRADYFANPHPRPMGMGLALFGRRRDGTEFPVEISLSPVMTEDGVLISAAIRDMTERRALEHAHAEAEERFRQAFESAPIGMVLVSPEGQVLRLNAALARILGVRDLAQAAAVLVDRIGPEAFAAWGAGFAGLLSGSSVDVALEQVWHLPKGDKWVNVQAVLVRNGDGTPANFIVQIEDVTDRKEAEAELRDAHAALVQSERLAAVGEMASVVSHEIRNPIGAITNALFLIRHALGTVPPELERQLALAEREAANATSIAEDLVAFARPRRPQMQSIALLSAVREVLEVLPPPAGVEVRIEDLDQTVVADRVHLTELFANLVANAYDAMPDGGRLTVTAHGEGHMVRVEV